MAYTVPADLRLETVKWWGQGLTLTATEISDADLTLVIAAVSQRIDDWTQDHFESETTVTEYIDGWNTSRLYPRRRIQSITSVAVQTVGGTTYTTLAATDYEVVSSISGSAVRIDGSDYIAVAYGRTVPGSGSGAWPHGPNAAKVIGTFSWPATPENIKKAVALLVYDEVKPQADILRRGTRLNEPDMSYDLGGTTSPSGIRPVDLLISQYMRDVGALLK